MKQKIWWRISLRNEKGRIIASDRVYALSRKEAKIQSAEKWKLVTTERITAVSDHSEG